MDGTAGGGRDTKIAEALALFARAAEPKRMWEVSGAGHVDMKRSQGTEYDARVPRFLSRYLGAPPIGDPPR